MLKTRGQCEKGSSLCFRVPFHVKMGLKIEKAQFTKRGRKIVVGNIWMDTDLAVGGHESLCYSQGGAATKMEVNKKGQIILQMQ